LAGLEILASGISFVPEVIKLLEFPKEGMVFRTWLEVSAANCMGATFANVGAARLDDSGNLDLFLI